MTELWTALRSLLPLLATTAALVAVLLALNWALLGRNRQLRKEQKFSRQLAMLVTTLAGIFVLLFMLPIERRDRDQAIGLLGLVVSGLVAYAASGPLGRIGAGIALRVRTPFRIGDHVRIGDHAGRVVDVGLFDVEIQSADRELISLPHDYVTAHPIGRIRSSGAIISATVSLGYGTHHVAVESLLREAALRSGLQDAFVGVVELGDFSVTYRVAGLLADVDSLITARSSLHRAMLDTLHEHDVEILSPAFVRRQPWLPAERLIPAPVLPVGSPESEARMEDVVFDKASQAAEIETEKKRINDALVDLEDRLADASQQDRPAIEWSVERAREHLVRLDEEATALDAEDEEET